MTLEILEERLTNMNSQFLGSISELKAFITSEFKEMKKRQDFTNGRVRKLENWRFALIGMGSILTFLVVPTALIVLKSLLE